MTDTASLRRGLRTLTLGVLLLLAVVSSQASTRSPAAARQLAHSDNRPSSAVMHFLRQHMRQRDPWYRTLDVAHRSAWVRVAVLPSPRRDHGGRGSLLLAYMEPQEDTCGTAGCDLDIFESRGGNWRKIGWVPVLPPIVLLPSEHLGYPDLGAIGGLLQPSARDPALLLFEHGRYRMSRTVRPAEPKGRVLIDDTPNGGEGALLRW